METKSLRVLFCFGNNQNFFDLPKSDIGPVWDATQELLSQIKNHQGVDLIGTFDDDTHMVGPSDGWPWTFYVLADVDSQANVQSVCNLLRTTMVGNFALWKYFKVEARIGRELTIRDDVQM